MAVLRHKEAIHSGQFMISHFEADAEDRADIGLDLTLDKREFIHSNSTNSGSIEVPAKNYEFSNFFIDKLLDTSVQQSHCASNGISKANFRSNYSHFSPCDNSSSRTEKTLSRIGIENRSISSFGCSNLTDNTLTVLYKSMSVAYHQKLTSPKWNRFRGLRIRWKDKIRLNNLIWRCWHLQFNQQSNALCAFANPLEIDNHVNTEGGTLLGGKYWKRRLKIIQQEYQSWRLYNTRAKKCKNLVKPMCNLDYYIFPHMVNNNDLIANNTPKDKVTTMIMLPNEMKNNNDNIALNCTTRVDDEELRTISSANQAERIELDLMYQEAELLVESFFNDQSKNHDLNDENGFSSHNSDLFQPGFRKNAFNYDFDPSTFMFTSGHGPSYRNAYNIDSSHDQNCNKTNIFNESNMLSYKNVLKGNFTNNINTFNEGQSPMSNTPEINTNNYSVKSNSNVFYDNVSNTIGNKAQNFRQTVPAKLLQLNEPPKKSEYMSYKCLPQTHCPKRSINYSIHGDPSQYVYQNRTEDPSRIEHFNENNCLQQTKLSNATGKEVHRGYQQYQIINNDDNKSELVKLLTCKTTMLNINLDKGCYQPNFPDNIERVSTKKQCKLKKTKNFQQFQPTQNITKKKNFLKRIQNDHIITEAKRRCTIKFGFEKLQSLLPVSTSQSDALKTNNDVRLSKAALLMQTGEYIEQIMSERKAVNLHITQLKETIDVLTNDIEVIQRKLSTSVGSADNNESFNQLCAYYEECQTYRWSKHGKNIKFWLFSQFFSTNMFSTFSDTVITTSIHDMGRTCMFWIDQHCSLSKLRSVFVNVLKKIAINTNISSTFQSSEQFSREIELLMVQRKSI